VISQIDVALTTYLLVALIKRTKAKFVMAFSNLGQKIKFCPYHYQTLDNIVNKVRNGIRKVSINQTEIIIEENLFSGKCLN
jgi:hypothetical protein